MLGNAAFTRRRLRRPAVRAHRVLAAISAAKIYAEAAQRFDVLAKEAVGYWSITSLNPTAESLIAHDVSDEQRSAYHSGQMIGLKLEEAVAPLIQAALDIMGKAHALLETLSERADSDEQRKKR